MKDNYVLTSLDEKVKVNIFCQNGKLFYSSSNLGVEKYKKASLGVLIGKNNQESEDFSACDYIVSVNEEKIINREFTVYGRCEKRYENCIRYEVKVAHKETFFILEVKVFDDGFAFRYIFDKEAGTFVFGEKTEYSLQKSSKVYATFGCRNPGCNTKLNGHPALCYESTYAEYNPAKKFKANRYVKEKDFVRDDDFYNYVLFPMTIRFKDGTFGSLMESEVYNYLGSSLRPFGGYRFGLNTEAAKVQFKVFEVENNVMTPWRVFTYAKDLNELYNNSIIHAVVEGVKKDYSFVKPGKSTWYWHVELCHGGSVNAKVAYDYTHTAAKMGFEYNILDGGWDLIVQEKDGKQIKGFDFLKELIKTTKEYDVGQICWCGFNGEIPQLNPDSFSDRGESPYSVKEFLDKIYENGGCGVKMDFFRAESNMYAGVNMYNMVADYCADKKMICDFHGSTKPTGLSAKYLNEVSREAIRGMENYFYSPKYYPDIAYGFTTLTFVRSLAGHGDWTPFVNDGIGLATCVLTDSPLSVISATPDELLNNPAREFIKSLPASFDKTVVFPESEFGKYVSIGKMKDNNWFIAGINSQNKTVRQHFKLKSFLKKGIYFMEMWFDTDEGLKSEYQALQEYDEVYVDVPANRGYVIRFSRLSFNYFGGEIIQDVIIKNMNNEKVYYTTDNTNPETSETRIEYKKIPIHLEKSCYLWAIAEKDGEIISKIKHKFNKI